MVRRAVGGPGDGRTPLQRINGAVSELVGRKQLPLDCYRRDRLFSWRARRRWVAPDLQPLPPGVAAHSGT